jgi:NADPH:quinone reductase
MRAFVMADHGASPGLVELDSPTAGAGEIRVKVRSSSLNGFDTALVHGFFLGIMEHQFPIVLGRDFAGTVDQVGAGVTDWAPGDDVFGVVLTQPLHAGGFGEYLVLPADHFIARIPAGVDHTTAGAIGLAAAAAVTAVERVAPVDGETVLVAGATGGVGAVAMQLLADRGAVVIATAAPGDEAAHVVAFGATHVVDRTADLAAQVRAIAPDGVDVVFHFAGDPFDLADLLVDGGRLASLLGIGPEAFEARKITAHSVAALPLPPVLERLAGDVAAGRLRIPIQRSYGLDEVPQAMADFAAGTIGKLVINIA